MANRLLLVASLEERLAAVEQMGVMRRAQPTGNVVATFSVPECSSGLQVVVLDDAGVVRLFAEATVPLVRGLTRLVCGVYDGERVRDIAGFETTILQRAEVWDAVSPIRQAGILGMLKRLQAALTALRKSARMNLQALTVCIHQGELLRGCVLNRAYFDRWTVVTVAEDTVTQALCGEFGLSCVVSRLPKLLGGAPVSMSDAGEYINEGLDALGDCEWVLLLGADVVLPREFRRRIEARELGERNLYSVGKPRRCRADSAQLLAQLFEWSPGRTGKGFFQLFHRQHYRGRFPDGVAENMWKDHETQFRSIYEEWRRKVLPMSVAVIKECDEGNIANDLSAEWISQTAPEGRCAVIGFPLAERLESLCARMSKVTVVPKGSAEPDDEDAQEIRRIFSEQTSESNNVEVGLGSFEDGSLDVLYLAEDVSVEWLCSELLTWLGKLKIGGLVCGDVFGFPHWPEATHTLVTLLGAPCGRGADGFWWKRYNGDARAISLVEDATGDVVIFNSLGLEQIEPLILSLSAARKYWNGPIRVSHQGDTSEALMLACARYGVELTAPRRRGLFAERSSVRELVMAPGWIAVEALSGAFEQCLQPQMTVPALGIWSNESTLEGPTLNARTVSANEYQGAGAVVEFTGPPETWSDAAWGVWCECEAAAASTNACEIATAHDATIVSIVTERDAGDFQRNWLSWRFTESIPIMLVLVDIVEDEFWLPGSERVRAICVTDEQASDTGALLKLVADACQTERVILVSPRASALPGAELWRKLPDGWAAIHFPSNAKSEIAVTGNRFIPEVWFAAIPASELHSLASRCLKVRTSELSRVFCKWAAERESNVVFSSMADFGWQFPGVFLQVDEPTKDQPGDGVIRIRPDGLLQLADDVVVISLPERTDRRERVTEMMSAENVWFRFGDGVRVTDAEIKPFEISEVGRQSFKMVAGFEKYLRGMVGCRRAHVRQLEAAKAAGLKSLLIIEDDMHFKEGWLETLQAGLSQLPEGWMQLYFSAGEFHPSVRVSRNLERLGGAWQMTCVLYSEAGIAAVLNAFRCSRCEIDHWLGVHLHPFGNSYVLDPQVTSQEGAVSDIMGFERGVTP